MEVFVKSLLFSIVLISLCSCGGRSSQGDIQDQVGNHQLDVKPFALPKLNFSRALTIDNNVSTLYEDMTIRSHGDGPILGDKAFYVLINEEVYPTYNEVILGFYSHTKVNNVLYFDSKNISFPVSEISKTNLPMLKLKDMTSTFKDRLSWGKLDLNNPDGDMLNKVFVIRTEEMEKSNKVEFKSESMYLIWFECKGDMKTINEFAYSCGKYNLKLNYKLLDYSLVSK